MAMARLTRPWLSTLMVLLTVLVLSEAVSAAVTATFSARRGILTARGDTADNNIEVSRNGAGLLLVNDGNVTIAGGVPTVSKTRLILVRAQAGNDAVVLNRVLGALPRALLRGGSGNDTLIGGRGNDVKLGEAGTMGSKWGAG